MIWTEKIITMTYLFVTEKISNNACNVAKHVYVRIYHSVRV